MSSTEALCISTQEQYSRLFDGETKISVACSGGVDSTVLFHIIFSMMKDKSRLSICHVSYGLRVEENAREIDLLQGLAASHGVSFFLRTVEESERLGRREKNTQNWARLVRYTFFQELCTDGWFVALGHHLDDAAENVLLRLSRGTRPVGLLGMSVWKKPYWRPFLFTKKEAILAWAQSKNLLYCEDSSNATMRYSRNTIRHKVLPVLEILFPGAKRRVVRCASEVRDLSAYVREGFYREGLAAQPSLDLDFLFRLPVGVAKEAIEVWLQEKTDEIPRLTDALYEELFHWIRSENRGQTCIWKRMLSKEVCIYIEQESLWFLYTGKK